MLCTLFIILTVFTGYHIVLWSGLALKVAIFVIKMFRKTIFFQVGKFFYKSGKIIIFSFQLPQGCEEYK